VSPPITEEVSPLVVSPEHSEQAGVATMSYLVIDEPPLLGAAQLRDAEAEPAVSLRILGAAAFVEGTVGIEASDLGPVPAAFEALTWKV
jgi:hypothetical protein